MEAAHSGGCGKRIEARQFFGRLDQAASRGHRFGAPLGMRGAVRPAPQARAEARGLGRSGIGVKSDVRAPRRP